MGWAQLLNQVVAIHGIPLPSVVSSVDYLVVAGGAAGGGTYGGGGGGAGAFRTAASFGVSGSLL